jgi:iron complex outermembrane receptor protein
MTNRNLRPTLIAAAVMALASQALAQTAPPSQATPERITITGSNIKRLQAETSSPVQVLTRTEIQQTGANTVRQILDTITATTANELRDDGSAASFAAGATGVSLRGLGLAGTLVLVNGRRIANYALANGAQITFVNIDSIAADAIERIEILKDGASAVYGSDAMAGVINIITRSNYQGVGVSASYQQGEEPQIGKQTTASIVGGFGDMDKQGFNVFGTVEFYKREGYFLSDIKDYAPDYQKRFVNAAYGDPSLISNPGNLFPVTVNATTGARTQGTRRASPLCPASMLNSANACVMDINGLNQQSDPSTRVNAFLAGRAKVGSMEAFAEASYSKTETEYLDLPFGINAPATPNRWFDGNTRTVQEAQKPLLAANNPANNTGGRAGLEYRFSDYLDMWSRPAEATQYHFLAGLKGSFAGWDYETTIARIGADGVSNGRGAHRTEYVNAVESGQYVIGGTNNSRALLERMFPKFGLNGENEQDVIDFKANGELFKLLGSPVMAAVGAEYRDEFVKIKSDDIVIQAQIVGRGAVWVEGKRKLAALFAELEHSPFKGLTANAALRYDEASGFDGRVSPKLGLKYELVPGQFLLRGTAAGGFRAPNIPESRGRIGLTGFFNGTVDPRRCDTATQIRNALNTGNANDRADATATFNSGCSVSLPAMISANPQIKPELSRSYTLGFVFDPLPNLSIAVDYFEIERRDEISFRSPSFVLARELTDPTYAALVARAPVSATDQARLARAQQLNPALAGLTWQAGDLTSLILQYENFGKTFSSGIDLDVRGRINGGEFGRVNLGLTVTYTLQRKEYDVTLNQYRPNRVGLRNAPRVRATATAAWSLGNWTHTARMNLTSKTSLNNDETDAASWDPSRCASRLNPGSLPCFRGEDLRFDVGVRYRGFKNALLGLDIGNLMGDQPPVNLRDGWTPRPRTWRVTGEYSF